MGHLVKEIEKSDAQYIKEINELYSNILYEEYFGYDSFMCDNNELDDVSQHNVNKVLDLYMGLIKENNEIPTLRDIGLKIAEYNFDVCFDIAQLEYELRTGKKRKDMKEEDEELINTYAVNMWNDRFSLSSNDLLKRVALELDKRNMAYFDDTYTTLISNQVFYDYSYKHGYLINDCQQLLYEPIHFSNMESYFSTRIIDSGDCERYELLERVRVVKKIESDSNHLLLNDVNYKVE